MATVLFLATKDSRQNATVRALQHAGHRCITSEPLIDDYERAVRALRDPPDVIVVEMSKQPFRGREAAAYLKDTKKCREVPVVFFNTAPADEGPATTKVPDATFSTVDGLVEAVAAAIAA